MKYRNFLMLGCILFLGCNLDVARPPAVEPKYGSLELNFTFDRPRAQVALQVCVAEAMYAEEEFWDFWTPYGPFIKYRVDAGQFSYEISDTNGLIVPIAGTLEVLDDVTTSIVVELETNLPDKVTGYGSYASIDPETIDRLYESLVAHPHELDFSTLSHPRFITRWNPNLLENHEGPELAFRISGLDPEAPLTDSVQVAVGEAGDHPPSFQVVQDLIRIGDDGVGVDLEAFDFPVNYVMITSLAHHERVLSMLRAVR